ncbi:MAG: filamentous hemagglutinin N-terminal domain-containing protein [Rivularia sp. (in: Bacteria)]|nr:filamentous hemagglutinin N-terminal domain-containing protein [Rivularia sp. MS3]
MFNYQAILLSLSVVFTLIPVSSVEAQLIPDNSLGNNNSIVTPVKPLKDIIDGGAVRGSNLFHSFKEFNIGNNRSVYFNNPSAIKNIFTRVTGSSQSNILGKLGVLGDANLFLINPNGIIFGKDASLDINGSFVGSTASFIDFADGTRFSAVSPDNVLLTISTPLGLGMGNNPGEIRLRGDGHKLSANRLPVPVIDDNTNALELNTGKTIALIGGDIFFEGGSLKTNSGSIELGSVGSGEVNFSFTPHLEFNYDKVKFFQDIQLSKQSSLQANSLYTNPNIENDLNNLASIQLKGRRISLEDASTIFVNNQGNLASKPININATESLQIIGTNLTQSQISSIQSQTFSTTEGSDINISTKHLFVKDGGFISVFSFGKKNSGDIKIKASDSIELSSALNTRYSIIATANFDDGNAGAIDISTSGLTIRNGGVMSSSSFAKGNAGNLTIDASEFIEVEGIDPNSNQISILSSTTFSAGNGGNLNINTRSLTVKNGGRVDASTLGSGAAGNMTINADDTIEITGSFPGLLSSQITSSATAAGEMTQQRFGLQSGATGESGTVNINTGQLNIADSAFLAVKNDGPENAGRLTVKANSININNQGSISATTASGRGGDIDLQTQSLLLTGNSNISVTSAGAENGGNININTQVLAALENSDISANSQGSFGGKVTINAKGILGTQFREFPSPESDITATSGKGAEFNGVVDINTIRLNPSFELTELSTGLTDSSQKIVAGCIANRASNFTAIGRGGLPENPSQLFTGNNPIVPIVDLVSTSENNLTSISSSSLMNNPKKEIVEAKGWIVDAQGNIEFVAEIPPVMNNSVGVRAVDCQSLAS